MILYLHGFRSSPLSSKAQAMALYLRERGLEGRFFCPHLPEAPRDAIRMAIEFMEGYSPDCITLIGSSLGGLYATWLAERRGCRAVLLNPVVDPWQIKVTVETAPDVLEVVEWEKERATYASELQALRIRQITHPERYFLIAATGDELLDYRLMSAHYQGARQIIIEGGDHNLADFPDYLDEVLLFSGIKVD